MRERKKPIRLRRTTTIPEAVSSNPVNEKEPLQELLEDCFGSSQLSEEFMEKCYGVLAECISTIHKELISENEELKEMVAESIFLQIFDQYTKRLTEFQKERMLGLCQNVPMNGEDPFQDFEEYMKKLRGTVYPKIQKDTGFEVEGFHEEARSQSAKMKKYINASNWVNQWRTKNDD